MQADDLINTQALRDAYTRAMNATSPAERFIMVQRVDHHDSAAAIARLVNQTYAIYAEASPAWSLTSMLRSLWYADTATNPKARPDELETLIVEEMSRQKRPLIINEVDYITLPGGGTRRMLDAIRSIGLRSGIPVVLVGSYEGELALRSSGLFPGLHTVQLISDRAHPHLLRPLNHPV